MSIRKPAASLLFRLPADLKDWLAEYAEENSRNMTGQLIEMIKAERDRAARGRTVDA